MRILWITEHYYPGTGGMAQSCDRIVSNLRDNGIQIDLVHLASKCRRRPAHSNHRGFDVCWSLNANPGHELNLLWNWLEQNLSSTDAETNDSNSSYSGVVGFGAHYALAAARNFAAWFSCPLFTMIRGNDFDLGIFDPRKSEFIESVYCSSHAVICVSKDKQQKLQALHPNLNVEHVATGIDPAEWVISKADWSKTTLLQKSFSDEKLTIGIFGHLKPKKGINFFLKTLAISGKLNCFHLLIVGEIGDDTIQLIESYSKNSEKPLEFTHYPITQRYELIPYYLACDCMAIPSYYDGTPNVMLESCLLGIPIIASEVGGMKDILTDNKTGWLFAPGNESELRNVLHRVSKMNKQQLQNIGSAARNLVLESHTAEIEAAQLMAIFKTD